MCEPERLLTRAIVRPPSESFREGLTTVNLGSPDYQLALKQHGAYCAALESCGLRVIALPPDYTHPDSTFVEDAAVLTSRCAIASLPGAITRRGEVYSVKQELEKWLTINSVIALPGTLDGGDVCEAGDHFFIGISARTNEAGAKQLGEVLRSRHYTYDLVDIRNIKGILHLKSGVSYLGTRRLAVIDALAQLKPFETYSQVRVKSEEAYAANCVLINNAVLVAAGFPCFERALIGLGYRTIPLEMSEFQKMDGGLSCLSLRF